MGTSQQLFRVVFQVAVPFVDRIGVTNVAEDLDIEEYLEYLEHFDDPLENDFT